MEINTVTISLSEYERLKGIEERYNQNDIKLLNDQIDEWKQKAEDNQRILKSWTKGFDRSAKNERRYFLEWLLHHLHNNCNKFGLMSKKKLKKLLVENNDVENYVNNKETFFDWVTENMEG